MNTTYDKLWSTFLNNCKISDVELPKTDEKIYEHIQNALLHFNNRMRTKLAGDDITETLNEELSGDYLLILAHFIRLVFLINQKTYFENTWQPFANDLGVKYYGTQLQSLRNSVETQQLSIERMIMFQEEDFL